LGLLNRIYNLEPRKQALLQAKHLPQSSHFLLEEAAPHIEAAKANRLKPGMAAEYHWLCADAYLAFVEDGQKQIAGMLEDAQRLCFTT
jgi:hypothetical protein